MRIDGLPLSVFMKHRMYIWFHPLLAFTRFIVGFHKKAEKDEDAYRQKLLEEYQRKQLKKGAH